MTDPRTVRLVGAAMLRSPLSHIGSTDSTTSWLVQEPVLQPDGSIEEVFCYGGNALRGMLRDSAARYFLAHIGNPTLALDAFHLLFAGGSIGGAQAVDIAKARQYRQLIPLVAIFGGGVGTQILPGKLRVQNLYPWCREAPAPHWTPPGAPSREQVSYADLTTEKSFSRMDDAKNPRYTPLLESPATGQIALLGDDGEPPTPTKGAKGKGKNDGGPPQQMRYTAELLIAGATLTMRIDCGDVTDAELGCLVSAFHEWSASPHLGGQANKGHGLVALELHLVDVLTGETQPFLTVADQCLLAPPAAAAKATYDQHLMRVYEAMLDTNAPATRQLIGVAS